jgi:lipopolysaccharide biosynthesis regulator YciM
MFIRLIIFFLFTSLSLSAQQDVTQLRETALTFQRQGDYTNAILVLNRALQQQPNDIMVLTDIAYTYYLQKDYAKAMEVMKPLLERDDAEIRTYQVGGNIFKAVEEVKECDKMYKKALKKYPNSGVLNSEYGELLWAKKEPELAISQWENGIQVDPAHSGNYYHAAKYYYAIPDKVWSLVYGEIFVNLESYSTRTAEIKMLLLESYKKFFTQSDVFKQYNARKKTPFEEAFLQTMEKQSSIATNGITTNSLIMIRTKFILDWFEGPGKKFPHRMLEQQQYLIREGMYDAYNQWLFGATANILEYQNWSNTNTEAQSKFTYYQRNRVFKMPPGQYYGAK